MTYDLSDPGLLLRPDVLDDPKPLHDQLRREAPIWQIPGQDTFVVSDPGLIKEAVGRTDDFSSNIVFVLHDDGNGCPVPHRISNYRDPIHVLSTADPPDHTRHRRMVQPNLSPAALAELEPAVEQIVDEHLARVLEHDRLDIVAAFSDPIPAATICALLGLPTSDVPTVLQLTLGTGALLDGVTDADGIVKAGESAMELGMFTYGRLQESLALPTEERHGILGWLADQMDAGELTEIEVLSMLTVFVSAGSETTASLLATAIETLARDPELQDRLRQDPSGIPDAVELMLREDGPFQFHFRYVPADTRLGGVAIPAGSRVLLMWASANRPAPGAPEWSAGGPGGEPTKLPPHYAFGRGIHFCIGAPVARLEARVAITRLLAATRSITLDPDSPMTRRPSIFIRRHATLPVVIEPA
jgi:cytochrome P450 family 144